METELHLPPPDYLSKLSFEVLVKILWYLPVQSLLRLESLSRHLQKAVGLHLQLVKSLDFTSDKWYGFMPEAIDDEALKLLLNRCNELEYIYGLHPSNLLLRKDDSKKCISIPGITNALQLCHRLVGVEISDIHLLEAILIELPNIEILGRFRNRGGCFPCNENSQLTLPSTSKLTCLHLYGIILSELPALNGLDELHLQFVKFSNPQPFQHFQSQWLLSFMMHNCIGPTNPLHYVPLLTALGNATHLRRLDLVRVPFLGGLLQHVVEDVWKKGGFSGVEKVRISTCKNCFETDIGYLLLASEYWLEELSLQPSLTKDSFFWALRLAKVNFNMFETLELGFVHPSIMSGEWTNAKLVEYGLTDYSEAPGLISDLGMSLVEIVFNSVISLTIHNCPHLQNPLLWCFEQTKKWEWLKSLHLDRCHSIQLDKFCQWLTDLPVIHDVRLEHMFRAPPKGCSMVGLSAGTGLGVSSALVAPIGQMDPSPNAADDQHENSNVNPDQAAERDDEVQLLPEPANRNNQLSNEKACQSTIQERGTSSQQTESSTSYGQPSRLYGSRSASDRGCSTDDLHVRVCRDEDEVSLRYEEQMNDEFSWQSLDQVDVKDSRSIKRKSSSSCAKKSQPLMSTAEKSRTGSGDILKQHQTSQQPQFKPSSKSVIASSSSSLPSPPPPPPSSSSSSSSLLISSKSSLSTVLATSSPSILTCSSSSLSSSPASSSLSVSSASSPLAALPSSSMPSSNFSQSSPSACQSSITSSTQNPDKFMEYDSQLSEQSSSSPLRKRKRQIQPNESVGTNEKVAEGNRSQKTPSTSRQGDASQGSSEQTTGMQNRCPTLEENFGLTCKAYVQECTYHDHSGQMRIRAVRTHSGQSSVIIPNNGPLYSLDQEPDIQHVRRSVPKSSSLHARQLDTEEEHVETSVQSNSIHRPAVSELNKRKIRSSPSGSYNHKVTNEDCEDSEDSDNDCDDVVDNYQHLYLKDNYTINDSIKGRKCKSSYKSVLKTDGMQLRKSHLDPCRSEEIGKVPEIKESVNTNCDPVKDNLNVPKTCIPKTANTSSVSSQRQFEHLPIVTCDESSNPVQQKAQAFHLSDHLASGNMDLCSSKTKHSEDDSTKLPKRRKVSTRNQSTSTSDPVPEDDPVQVMVITSKTLEGLTLESCGVSHLHLIDCPQLATLSGYDLRILRNLKVKNCPSLAHIDFSQVPRLSNPAVLEPLTWLPPTCSRFVKLSTLNMKSKSALESWLFAIDHCKYQLMYAIESKASTGSIEGSVYMANWMDITTWLNKYYISTLTYSNDEDSRGKKKTRKSSVPKNIFITKCSIGSSRFKLSTDVPWLRTLSSNNDCQMEFGKPLPEVYPAERSDIVATLARRCTLPLTHDMAEMRSMKISFMKSVLCIYIQMSDINKQKKEPNI